MEKICNIIICFKNFCKPLANSLAMITTQQIRIHDIEETTIKSDEKKIKYYQISKKLLEAFGQFSGRDHKRAN